MRFWSRDGIANTLAGQSLAEVQEASRILIGSRARFQSEGDRAAALLGSHPAGAVWRFWEWNRVRLLASHRARQLGVSCGLWDEQAGQLEGWARELAVQQELAALKAVRLLAHHGIPAVVLKGPGLAHRLHGDPALRDPSSDVDLLTSADQLHRGTEVLAKHGWSMTDEAITNGGFPDLHFAMLGAKGMPSVELHWRMQWYSRLDHTAHILRNAEEVNGLPRPSLADLPHVLLLFWMRDGFHRMRLLADYAAALDQVGDAPFPPVRELARPLEGSAQVARALLSPPVESVPRRVKVAIQIARADPHSKPRREYSQVVLVAALLAGRYHRRHTLLELWLRDPAILASRHTGLKPWTLLPARALSAFRTTGGALVLVWSSRKNRLTSELAQRPTGRRVYRDSLCWDARPDLTRGDIVEHDRIGPDHRVVANRQLLACSEQNYGIRSDDNPVAYYNAPSARYLIAW